MYRINIEDQARNTKFDHGNTCAIFNGSIHAVGKT